MAPLAPIRGLLVRLISPLALLAPLAPMSVIKTRNFSPRVLTWGGSGPGNEFSTAFTDQLLSRAREPSTSQRGLEALTAGLLHADASLGIGQLLGQGRI